MATTTNYGWTTPDDTSLVKDGAAAIRTLGSSVDTTVKALSPGTTAGDLDYYTSGTAKSRIGIGTSGQVLAVNGSNVPAWTTISTGGMTLISSTTASAISSLDFTSIPQGYKHLFLRWSGLTHAGLGGFTTRLNSDTGSNYSYLWYANDAGTPNFDYGTYTSITGASSKWGIFGYDLSGITAYERLAKGSMTIYNYSSTSLYKDIVYTNNMGNNSAIYNIIDWKSIYKSTTAITSINISGGTTVTNSTGTRIELWGIS